MSHVFPYQSRYRLSTVYVAEAGSVFDHGMNGSRFDPSMDYYREACSREHLLPGGKPVKLSPFTLKKWYRLYASGGLQALLPRARSDSGESRVLSMDACRQVEAYRKNGI